MASNTASTTATNPTQISPTDELGFYPNGYQPSMTYVSKDWDAVGGIRLGNSGIGHLDVGVSYGRDETGRYTYSSVNPSWGPSSPESFYLGSWADDMTSVTADYKKDLSIPFVDSTVLSAGALFRHESWGTDNVGDYIGYAPGPLAGLPLWAPYSTPNTVYTGTTAAYAGKTAAQVAGSYAGIYDQYASQFPGINFSAASGSIGATGSSTAGISPVDTGTYSRHVSGGYVGFDSKVTSKLDVGATGRFEDYSDFGSTTNYRVTARYEFVPQFALRGTVSSGFHAPSLAEIGQQVTSYTGTFSNNGISILTPGYTRQFRPSDPTAAAFGAKPLEPEKSTTYSVGFVIRPEETSSITIDAYDLKIDHVITVTDPIQGAAVSAAFAAAGLPGYTQATYYLNAWNARTDGIDIVGQKYFILPVGRLDLSLAGSYHTTQVSDPNNMVTIGGTRIDVLNNSHFRDAETGVPKTKVILSGRYSLGPWGGIDRYPLQQLPLQRRQYPERRAGQRQRRPGVLARDLSRPARVLQHPREPAPGRLCSEPTRPVSGQVCRRQSLERHQPVFVHCAQWRLRAIRPGRCQLELLMRLRPSMDRREFLAGSAAAVAAATVATRYLDGLTSI